MKDMYNIAETGLNAFGIMVSVQDLESWINIALLIVSVVSILFRLGYNIYVKIKRGDISGIQSDIDSLKDTLQDVKENISTKEDDKDGKED